VEVPSSGKPSIGTHFDLTIDYFAGELHGTASACNCGERLRARTNAAMAGGDTVTLPVTNRLKAISAIHWHAIRLSANMDGVPGLSFPGIPPNKTFTYRIPVVQSSTY